MLPQRGAVFVIILEKTRKILHKVRDNSVGTDPKEESHHIIFNMLTLNN